MKSGVNIGYAFGRLQRALAHAERSDEADSTDRVEAWLQSIRGMLSGEIEVGSRSPVAGTPAWVTLEVLHGGFASGRHAAGGPLCDWERAALEELSEAAIGGNERERLNLWYLSDPGQAALLRAHAESGVKIDVPEEGALLAVALLVENDAYEAARIVIEQIVDWFDRLRFYPELTAVSRVSGAVVHRRTAREVSRVLAERKPQSQVVAMQRTLQVWNPLYDRLVQLWLNADVTAPALWREQRDAIRRDVADAAKAGVPRRFRDPKGPFQQLLGARDRDAAAGPLQRAMSRWGAPESDAHAALRAEQARTAAEPLHADIAHVVAERLGRVPAGLGIKSPDDVCAPIEAGESERVHKGTEVPTYLADKTLMALDAPVAELVHSGVIGSGEVLAEVVPQLTAAVAASGILDEELRALYSALYAAFRGRRSLLLLNYAHQVRFEELPWVSALARFRSDPRGEQRQASEFLKDLVQLYLETFPHTQIPNPLITELGALAKSAGLEIPLVEELAADIFMGGFTPKFARAGQITAEWMSGTVYARYYDLDNARLGDFAEACARRAEESKFGPSVARNGAIIEQASILTTHNLAPLCQALELRDHLVDLAPDVVPRIAEWITAQLDATKAYGRSRTVRRAAVAWRQMVFFLSFVPEDRRGAAVDAVAAQFDRNVVVAGDFASTVNGLRLVVDGGALSSEGTAEFRGAPARRFLGWSSARDFT